MATVTDARPLSSDPFGEGVEYFCVETDGTNVVGDRAFRYSTGVSGNVGELWVRKTDDKTDVQLTVDVTKWRKIDGDSYDLPAGTNVFTIPANGLEFGLSAVAGASGATITQVSFLRENGAGKNYTGNPDFVIPGSGTVDLSWTDTKYNIVQISYTSTETLSIAWDTGLASGGASAQATATEWTTVAALPDLVVAGGAVGVVDTADATRLALFTAEPVTSQTLVNYAATDPTAVSYHEKIQVGERFENPTGYKGEVRFFSVTGQTYKLTKVV